MEGGAHPPRRANASNLLFLASASPLGLRPLKSGRPTPILPELSEGRVRLPGLALFCGVCLELGAERTRVPNLRTALATEVNSAGPKRAVVESRLELRLQVGLGLAGDGSWVRAPNAPCLTCTACIEPYYTIPKSKFFCVNLCVLDSRSVHSKFDIGMG